MHATHFFFFSFSFFFLLISSHHLVVVSFFFCLFLLTSSMYVVLFFSPLWIWIWIYLFILFLFICFNCHGYGYASHQCLSCMTSSHQCFLHIHINNKLYFFNKNKLMNKKIVWIWWWVFHILFEDWFISKVISSEISSFGRFWNSFLTLLLINLVLLNIIEGNYIIKL